MGGGPVDHPNTRGVVCSARHQPHASLSRSHPVRWYLERDMGYVNKIFRGLAFANDAPPDEFGGQTIGSGSLWSKCSRS
jgi:hypothetical protein